MNLLSDGALVDDVATMGSDLDQLLERGRLLGLVGLVT
jgi:hypothetical protein